ncbi:MAG: serine/threonine-protein kinase [Vulcanimicrobiota bacterium]
MDYAQIPQGEVLDGRFEVKRLVKSGGMGAVYKVNDRLLGGKTFAAKQIRPSADPKEFQLAKSHFIGEIGVMQSLHHPNIPKIISSFFRDDSFFFVMEFVDGIDLSAYRKKHGNPGLPVDRVVGWTVQVLDALSYVHERPSPITHRDIKPSNILLDEQNNRVVLIDFGIAHATDPADGWIGTPGYAAAEQQMGQPEPRSDLFALAATIHELLTGVRPRGFDFKSLAELKVKAPDGLQEILKEALEPWAEDRISSAQEMKERLLALPGLSIQGPIENREHTFDTAADVLNRMAIMPGLKELIERFGAECQTPYIPTTLSFNKFVLGTLTSFELVITKDDQRESVRFEEKQGLLAPVLLGEVYPLGNDSPEQVRAIIDRFASDYEEFKNSSWQIL